MYAVSNPIIQTSVVQGHPGSEFIVIIESPSMACYLTSFKSNIVSVIYSRYLLQKSLT